MKICKYPEIHKSDYLEILLQEWLKADDAKSEKRKISSRLADTCKT